MPFNLLNYYTASIPDSKLDIGLLHISRRKYSDFNGRSYQNANTIPDVDNAISKMQVKIFHTKCIL